MEIRQEGSITTVRNGNDVLCLIPDATGLAPATRSDWIHHKHRKARGFIKLSVMINYMEWGRIRGVGRSTAAHGVR